MGLYDTVIIENLKLKTPPEVKQYLKAAERELPNDFQTKDLDSSMITYYIDGDQMYMDHYVETGKRVKQDNFWEKWKDNRSFVERMYFKYKTKSLFNKPLSRTIPELKKIKQKYNGTHTFNFYTYEEIGGRYLDLEYKAEVVSGKVKKIEPVKFEIEGVSAAKKRKADREIFDKKMQESFEARKRFTSTWYYPILREVYNPLVFVAKNTIQWICQRIISWSYRWHGV